MQPVSLNILSIIKALIIFPPHGIAVTFVYTTGTKFKHKISNLSLLMSSKKN